MVYLKSFEFRQMIIIVLLAVFCYGLIEDYKFTVTKCNNDDDRPELTFTIDKDYFNLNLFWQADQVNFEITLTLTRKF